MDRKVTGQCFNDSINGQHCMLIDPKTNESLNSDTDAQIMASTDQYAMYLKLTLQAKSNADDPLEGPTAVVYIYCNNFIGYALREADASICDLPDDRKPSLTRYKRYILDLKLDLHNLANENFSVGAPVFATAFRNSVLNTNAIKVMFYATGNVVTSLQDMVNIFKNENAESPWMHLHNTDVIASTQGRGSFALSDLLSPEKAKSPPAGAYPPQVTFSSFFHYATVQALGSKAEQDYCEKEIIQFEAKEHNLLLVRQPKMQGEFLGILGRPEDSKIRLRTNDVIKIRIDEASDLFRITLLAKVIAPSNTLPRDAISFIVTWPKKDDGTYYSTAGVSIITEEDMRRAGVRLSYIWTSQLRLRKLIKVKIDLCQRGHELGINLNALSRINNAVVRDQEQHHTLLYQWGKVLCASRLDTLDDRDIFSDIRGKFPNPENHMHLNSSQTEAIRYGEHAIAGILNVHGPPGTGKTTMICECAKLYFQLSSHNQVVALSTTNLSVDALASRMHNDLQQLQHQGNAAKSGYVVRLHSVEAELSIFLRRINEVRGEQNQTNMKNVDLSTLSETEKLTMEHLSYSTAHSDKYITDNRVQLKELSAGSRMLLEIGRNAEGQVLTSPEDYAEINELFESSLVKTNGKFSATAFKVLQEKAMELYKKVLQGATAVVATVARAALPSMNINASIMFIDEASRIDEATMWSIMALNHTRLKGMVLVGDPYQLRNLVTSPTSINVFAEQKKMTLPERLLAVGFPTHLLDTQMRMVPEIAEPSAKIIYRGCLQNGPGTAAGSRSLARELLAYNEQKWGKKASLIYLNIHRSEAAKTQRLDGNGSRKNTFFIRQAFNEIERLLKLFPTATIAFATPYTEDKQIALSCQAEMKAHKTEFPDINNLHVVTWDTSQGLEFDIGFVVLPLIPGAGSIAHEKGRVNVISTRWRCGLYLIGTDSSVMSSRPGGTQTRDWLDEFRSKYWKKNMVDIKDTESFPPCRWMKGQPELTHKRNHKARHRRDWSESSEDAW